jgi:hypothetical protein
MNFTIKGLKTWSTYDAGGYQFTLYRDGKKFAFVHNDGNGGPTDFHFADEPYFNDRGTYRKELEDYCKTLPKWKGSDGEFRDTTPEIFAGELVDDHLNAKKIARLRKSSILFRLSSDHEDVIRMVKTLDMDLAKRILEKKYPGSYQFI